MYTDLSGPRERPEILDDEAHLWCLAPAAVTGAGLVPAFEELLSDDERVRYKGYRFRRDRELFLSAHVLLRMVLSRYADVDPHAWEFSCNEHGKPEIAAPDIAFNLRFNLSHTPGLAVCLVTNDLDCGVDVEQVTQHRRASAVAERMFAAAELEALSGLAGRHYLQRFFTYWTLREALCKAIGTGLARNPSGQWFEPLDSGSYRLCRAGGGALHRQWQCLVTEPTASHVAAMVLRRAGDTDRRLVIRHYQPLT